MNIKNQFNTRLGCEYDYDSIDLVGKHADKLL